MMHGGNVWQGANPGQWLDFSANLRPEGAPDWALQAMQRGMENVRYYPDPEMKRAAAALAKYLGVDADCVCPTAGGISAIQMANHLPARETLLLTPCFGEYEQLAQSPVRKLSLIRNRHEIALPDAIPLQKDSLVWLCNPMNPVGCAFSPEDIRALLDQIEAQGAYLAVDEAFIKYCPENSALHCIKNHDRLLIAGSMTKILGVPGVRIGYLCAQPKLLQKLKARQLTWELNCFAEAVICALPDHADEIRADAARNADRRRALIEGLEGLGVFVYPSQSACVLADFGRPTAPIAEKLLQKNILVRSCMNFDGINDGRHLRLAVRDEISNRRLIQALQEVLTCAENH